MGTGANCCTTEDKLTGNLSLNREKYIDQHGKVQYRESGGAGSVYTVKVNTAGVLDATAGGSGSN